VYTELVNETKFL